VCHANGRHPQHRAQLKREARTARVIPPRRVDQQHLGHPWQDANGGPEQRTLARRQQPRSTPPSHARGWRQSTWSWPDATIWHKNSRSSVADLTILAKLGRPREGAIRAARALVSPRAETVAALERR
jgi:hypothetical protein